MHFSLQAIFPVSSLISNSLNFPAKADDVLKQYQFFPKLSVQSTSLNSEKGPRRVHLELYLGWVDYNVFCYTKSGLCQGIQITVLIGIVVWLVSHFLLVGWFLFIKMLVSSRCSNGEICFTRIFEFHNVFYDYCNITCL